MEQPEDLLEIALGAADPAVAEIFHLHDRDSRLASEALDEVGLARADRTAEQVTHRHRPEIALPPERDVLTHPGFHRLAAVDIVESSGRLEELDEILRIFFDERLFQIRKIVLEQGRLFILTLFQERLDRADRRPRETGRGELGLPREIRESGRVDLFKKAEGSVQLARARHRDLDLGGALVLGKEVIEIIEVLSEEQHREILLEEKTLVRPGAHDRGHGIELIIADLLRDGKDELGGLDDDRDVVIAPRQDRSLGQARREAAQVDAEAQELVEIADRLHRIFRQFIGKAQLLEKRLTRLDPQPRPEFVAKDEVKTLELLLCQELDEIAHHRALGSRFPDEEPVLDVAVNDELVRRVGEIESADRVRPGRCGHGNFSSATLRRNAAKVNS